MESLFWQLLRQWVQSEGLHRILCIHYSSDPLHFVLARSPSVLSLLPSFDRKCRRKQRREQIQQPWHLTIWSCEGLFLRQENKISACLRSGGRTPPHGWRGLITSSTGRESLSRFRGSMRRLFAT